MQALAPSLIHANTTKTISSAAAAAALFSFISEFNEASSIPNTEMKKERNRPKKDCALNDECDIFYFEFVLA